MESLNFKVSGINCEACTKIIKMDLEEILSVKEVKVGLDGQVRVDSDKPVTLEEIKKILAGSEYKIVEE